MFVLFFCSYGTAENKYLNVPHTSVVVEFKMQLALRYGVVRAWLRPLSKYVNLLKTDLRQQT